MGLTSSPKLTSSMTESPAYQSMGVGYTDRLFLLGHADGLTLNEPFPVSSVRDAVAALGANTDSPLLRGLLEAYYCGARDIWLVAVAPMSEYQADLELRDQTYYTTYATRLEAAYDVLKDWDIAQITVPIDAPFNSSVDFLSPLVNHCVETYAASGNLHLGILGTRGPLTEELANKLIADTRISMLGEAGKFVSVFAGEVTFGIREMPVNYSGSAATAIAGELTQMPLNRGVTYQTIRQALSIVGQDLSPTKINELAEAKINYVGRNARGRRGALFNVISFTDNTLAPDGSDYWSLVQLRLCARVINEVRSMGYRALGTIGFDLFKSNVDSYLLRLAADDLIRGYTIDIQRNHYDPMTVHVDLILRPYLGVREIHVPILISPEER